MKYHRSTCKDPEVGGDSMCQEKKREGSKTQVRSKEEHRLGKKGRGHTVTREQVARGMGGFKQVFVLILITWHHC